MNIFYINGIRLVIIDHMNRICEREIDVNKINELNEMTKKLIKKNNVKIILNSNEYT